MAIELAIWFKGLAVSVGISTLRGILGWLNSALQDGKIDTFEWRRLAETILRIGVPAFAAYVGLDLMGFDINILAPAIIASIIDWYYSMFKKTAKK